MAVPWEASLRVRELIIHFPDPVVTAVRAAHDKRIHVYAHKSVSEGILLLYRYN